MSTSSSDSVTNGRAPYEEFIATHLKAWPQFGWLRDFLKHKPNASTTRVTIFDSSGATLKERSQFSEDFSELGRTLASEPQEAETRLIIVTYKDSWSCDRTVINQLGLFYDIDPEFFRQHFYYSIMHTEDSAPRDSWKDGDPYSKRTLLLPYEQSTQQLHISFTHECDKLSAYIASKGTSNYKIVLIWIRSSFGFGKHDAQRTRFQSSIWPSMSETPREAEKRRQAYGAHPYVDALRNSTESDIEAGQKQLIYYLFPYIRYVLLMFYDLYKDEMAPTDIDRMDAATSTAGLKNFNSKLTEIGVNVVSLRAFREQISRPTEFLGSHPISRPYQLLLADVDELQRKMEGAELFYRESKRDMMTTSQIEEARISTTLAITVNRLTKLAFVFIPLTFTTSIFGMNVAELGQGTTPIRSVVITAVVVAAITILPFLPLLFRAITHPDLVHSSKVMLVLLRRWPKGGFWYIMLRVRVGDDLLLSLCGYELMRAFNILEIADLKKLDTETEYTRLEKLIPGHRERRFWKAKTGMLEEYARKMTDDE